jgi:hypothetical protein
MLLKNTMTNDLRNNNPLLGRSVVNHYDSVADISRGLKAKK